MAKFVSNDFNIFLNDVDLSTSIASATLDISREEQITTAFGQTSVTRIGGLQDASLTLEFMQDFGAAGVDSTLFPLLGTVVSFKIKPTSGAISATNPEYSGELLVNSYSPFDSASGELATFSITLPVSGDITRTEVAPI
jgi:hypothetical protein